MDPTGLHALVVEGLIFREASDAALFLLVFGNGIATYGIRYYMASTGRRAYGANSRTTRERRTLLKAV
jgi:hypothetical protein